MSRREGGAATGIGGTGRTAAGLDGRWGCPMSYSGPCPERYTLIAVGGGRRG